MEIKTKLRLGTVVCISITVLIWVIFIAPIFVIAYSLAKYYFLSEDFSANSTISDVFDEISCKNYTLQQAIVAIKSVATGNFSRNFTCTTPYLSNGTQCVPECLEWHPGGDVYYRLFRYTVPVFSCVTTIIGLVGASTWLLLRKLWTFPHIISLYLLINVIGQGLMIFIGSLFPQQFYCTDSDLLVSRLNPTIPCHFQGALFQFFLLSFMCWYICDVFNILYVMLWPLKADNFLKHRNKIHIIESIICWGIPALLVIIIGAAQGYEIVSVPVTCLPMTLVTFGTFFLPGIIFSILTQTSFALLGTILYRRHVMNATRTTTNRDYLDTLQQIALFSTSFTFLTIAILVNYACLSTGLGEFAEYTSTYWQCITVFGSKNKCCRPIYIDFYYPFTGFLSDSAFCTWGMVGAAAVAVKEAKNIWKRGFRRCFKNIQTTAHGWTGRSDASKNEIVLAEVNK